MHLTRLIIILPYMTKMPIIISPQTQKEEASLVDSRAPALPIRAIQSHQSTISEVFDQMNRPLEDLRISVTDRCNFRCQYCMPKTVFDRNHHFLPHSQLLTFEEIHQIASKFLQLGVKKLRITGGEPLLRKHIEKLIEQLAQLRMPNGQPPELTMTTNATLLAQKASALKAAGLNRVTISLDAIDDKIFRLLNDMNVPVSTVLNGIQAASKAGLTPIKVNMVVRKGINEQQILPMVKHFRHTGIILRFIEFMDVGSTNGWRMEEVLPSQEIINKINETFPIHPLEPHTPSETAQRWAFDDGAGEIGVISSVTRAFCHSCTRARLSMEGRLFLCLFASAGYDLRALLRQNLDDKTLRASIANLWHQRDNHYSELRVQGVHAKRHVEMSYIGG